MLAAVQQRNQSRVRTEISNCYNGTPGQLSQASLKAVISHLECSCCWRTMRALVSAIEKQQPPSVDREVNASSVDVEGMKQREEVISLIIQGKILEVCALGRDCTRAAWRPAYTTRCLAPVLENGTEHIWGWCRTHLCLQVFHSSSCGNFMLG